MYLAKHVGGWSTTKIGRFYNGRHHTTVLYSISKIELQRKRDPAFDALLEVLAGAIGDGNDFAGTAAPIPNCSEQFVDVIAERVIERLQLHCPDMDSR